MFYWELGKSIPELSSNTPPYVLSKAKCTLFPQCSVLAPTHFLDNLSIHLPGIALAINKHNIIRTVTDPYIHMYFHLPIKHQPPYQQTKKNIFFLFSFCKRCLDISCEFSITHMIYMKFQTFNIFHFFFFFFKFRIISATTLIGIVRLK